MLRGIRRRDCSRLGQAPPELPRCRRPASSLSCLTSDLPSSAASCGAVGRSGGGTERSRAPRVCRGQRGLRCATAARVFVRVAEPSALTHAERESLRVTLGRRSRDTADWVGPGPLTNKDQLRSVFEALMWDSLTRFRVGRETRCCRRSCGVPRPAGTGDPRRGGRESAIV